MRTFSVISYNKEGYYFPKIQYLNFVNICKRYLFKNKIFIFTKYIGFLIEDLLFHLFYLIEQEIAYIISQVSRTLPFPNPTFINIAGLGWHTIYLV
jgi:hypothetical protein